MARSGTLTEEATTGGGDGGSGLRARLGRLFSLRYFLVAVLAAGAGVLLGGLVPFLGTLGGFVGVGVAGFLAGVAGRRRYLETATAGGLVAGVAAVQEYLVLALATGVGPALWLVAAAAGALAGLVGHYLGRDLRAGFTREL